METVVDLDPEAYRVAQERAAAQGVTLGKVLGDALLGRVAESPVEAKLETDGDGWPVLRFGHPLSIEEAKALVEED